MTIQPKKNENLFKKPETKSKNIRTTDIFSIDLSNEDRKVRHGNGVPSEHRMGNSIDILVEKVSAGDNEAFRELCELKYKSIYFQAYEILGNHHDAEDVAQVVVLKIYEKIGTLRSKYAFSAWVYRLVTNECNMVLRKQITRKEDMTYDEETDLRKEENTEILPEKNMEESEFEDYLATIIGRLPKQRQRCVYLYYYEGLKYKEIAEIMGISMNTVATNIKRAKDMIKKEIEQSTDYEIVYKDEVHNDE